MSGRSRSLGRLRLASVWLMVAFLAWFSNPEVVALAIGIPLVLLGESVRGWAAGYLMKSVELAVDGPYRFTRNPLYLGRLLIFSGLVVVSPLPWRAHLILGLAGWIVFFGFYLPRKERVEPERLLSIHGAEYERYRRSIPALWPTLHPYPAGRAIWSSQRFLANREHWMVIGLAAYILLQSFRVLAG